MKQRILFLSICIFFFTQVTLSQDTQNESNRDETLIDEYREITFENDSRPVEIAIAINSNVRRLRLTINSSVQSGNLSIEIYDPQKTKQGNYSVGTQTRTEAKETVQGSIKKALFEPLSGDWIVKIAPKFATGRVTIQTIISE